MEEGNCPQEEGGEQSVGESVQEDNSSDSEENRGNSVRFTSSVFDYEESEGDKETATTHRQVRSNTSPFEYQANSLNNVSAVLAFHLLF